MTTCALQGLDFLHSHRIAHRDIKPENLFFKTKGDCKSIVIGDFGLLAQREPKGTFQTSCGTVVYAAPEICSCRRYTEKCDVYSLGVVLFGVMSGHDLNRKKGYTQNWKKMQQYRQHARVNPA